MTIRSTRRTLLVTGAAVLVAGCSKYGDGNESGGSATPSTPSTSAGASGSAGGTSGGRVLAKTSDIPVGGGRIFKEQKVVVTQPAKGEFHAFSAVCTHQGCLVNKVADGTIDCPCHGSRFHVDDGSVAHGPATRPLPYQTIRVKGDTISLP
ncbi:Rieske (2Fe-2S) protein [Streptomyces yaanensis]|uniref:Cytochrome bc1 complex Rieske iron-sulfur subunit n=1 Tax=Streptomyces yaanensis TaxID=1142239 RepID=A0ABV7SK46_9ACTN|nr:Rieske (2Fe-2S) protein [Streptomyces sp. CGMCC 4.7035]WNC00961.1 Rieske (2Fe-2S) protein [Streptomyces sp. CGMCC 4.7035]